MKKMRKYLALALVLCLTLALCPSLALAAENETAGTYEEFAAALGNVSDGGTITLTAKITGDPINICAYEKSFTIDRTAGNFFHPALLGCYQDAGDYYDAAGYGAAGITLTHWKVRNGNVHTYTYAPISDSEIAAYVTKAGTAADKVSYPSKTIAGALEAVGLNSVNQLYLMTDFTEEVTTTKGDAFTLYPNGHAATGIIRNNGTSITFDTSSVVNQDGSIAYSFTRYDFKVSDGMTAYNYLAAAAADAFAKANELAAAGAVTIAQTYRATVSSPVSLAAAVKLTIAAGKTLTLASDFTVNGTLENSGTIQLCEGAALKVKSGSAGTVTVPKNFTLVSAVEGGFTSYSTAATDNVEVKIIQPDGSERVCGTFLTAVDSASDGDTIQLLKPVTLSTLMAISIGKNLTIDLAGQTLTKSAGVGYPMFRITAGTLTLQDRIPASTGKLSAAEMAFEVDGPGAKLVIDAGSHVESGGSGIYVHNGAQADVYGSVRSTGVQATISGNGSDGEGNTTIRIYDGAEVESVGSIALYLPQAGTAYVYGGSITGSTAIYVKSGTLAISGGSVTGNGAAAEPSYNGSGANPTGDALVVDSCGYPGGAPAVTVSDGTFTSINALALRACMTQGSTAARQFAVTGGSFSSDPTAYVASGYLASDSAPYTVAAVYVPPAPSTTPAKETKTVGTVTTETVTETTVTSDGSKRTETTQVATDTATGAVTETRTTVLEDPKTGVSAATEFVTDADGATAATVTASASAAAVTGADGKVTAALDEDTAAALREQAVKAVAAAQAETENVKATVTIQVETAAPEVDVRVPAAALSTLADTGAEVKIAAGVASVTMDAGVLRAVGAAADEDTAEAVFSVKAVEPAALPEAAQTQLEEALVVDLTLTVGDTQVSDFQGGFVTVSVPYTPRDAEKSISVYYVDDRGALTYVPGAAYDPATGLVIFRTGHFSSYAIVEEDWVNPFRDVAADAWYYGAVRYACQNGLFKGLSDADFGPGTSMTRAMLVTVLWRLAGEPVVNYAMDFSDVPAEAYYAEAVRWAASQRLVDGYGDGRFGADDPITREQLALLLYRRAGTPAVSGAMGMAGYADVDTISAWAGDAMRWAVSGGLIQGADGRLSPQGEASRAQVAAILMRLLESAEK